MARPDYQGALGFELVTVAQPNGGEMHLIREAGAEDREATLPERVLWGQMVALLDALQTLRDSDGFMHLLDRDQEVIEAAIAKATGEGA